MARRIRIEQHGGPEVLKVEQYEVGEPGPGEARVRQTAIGLNFIDTYFRSGLYPPPSGLPFTPGNEAAGVVEAVGEGVTEVKVGQRVAYASSLGAYADERLVPAKVLVPLPEGVSDEQAAAMMLKGMTAQYLLRQTYVVKRGDTILVHAAAGGVGLIMVQWAKDWAPRSSARSAARTRPRSRGSTAPTTSSSTSRRTSPSAWSRSPAAKLPVVYDGVGKATFMKSLDCLRPRGLMVTFGNAAGRWTRSTSASCRRRARSTSPGRPCSATPRRATSSWPAPTTCSAS